MEELYSEYCRNKLKSDSLVQKYAYTFFKVCIHCHCIKAIAARDVVEKTSPSVFIMFKTSLRSKCFRRNQLRIRYGKTSSPSSFLDLLARKRLLRRLIYKYGKYTTGYRL